MAMTPGPSDSNQCHRCSQCDADKKPNEFSSSQLARGPGQQRCWGCSNPRLHAKRQLERELPAHLCKRKQDCYQSAVVARDLLGARMRYAPADIVLAFDGSAACDQNGSHRGVIEPDGAAAIIFFGASQLQTISAQLPHSGTKLSEWMGLLLGLWQLSEVLVEPPLGSLRIQGDNQSLIKMLNGGNRRHDPTLPAFEALCALEAEQLIQQWISRHGRVSCVWVPREENVEADAAAGSARTIGEPLPARAKRFHEAILAPRRADGGDSPCLSARAR